MSIDFKKLKTLLETHQITPLEYFCMDNECTLIKCFFNKNGEFLLIYIPSKFRFTIKAENNEKIYEIEDADETTENDDYSKNDKVPDMSMIEEDSNSNSYKELSKKYEKNISLEGDDEPVSRKIKRQIGRVKIPFARLSYDVALQNGKWMCASFGDDISLFTIKGYPTANRCFLFLTILTDFIEKVETMTDRLFIIKEQFYQIIKNVSLSNLDTVKDDIDNYPTVIKSILSKNDKYQKVTQEYSVLYKQTKENEDSVIKKFKEKISKEQGIVKSTSESAFQKQYATLLKTCNDVVAKGVDSAHRFQKNILILEEVSFDNVIMLIRVKKNFELFKEIL